LKVLLGFENGEAVFKTKTYSRCGDQRSCRLSKKRGIQSENPHM